mgnify:CR=1 FL=1
MNALPTVAAEAARERVVNAALEPIHTMGGKVTTGVPPAARERNWQAEDEMQVWVGEYVRNIALHYPEILAAPHIGPLRELFGAWDALDKTGRPSVAVVGAGPSLDRNVEELRAFPGLVLATDRAARALTARAIPFDAVVAVDPRAHHIAAMLDYPESCNQILLTSVCVAPDVFEAWKGRVLYMSHQNPGTQFFDCVLPVLFPGMPAPYVLGNVGNMAVQLAAYMGAGKIVLVGQDYGYTGGKISADDWYFNYDGIESSDKFWVRLLPDHAALLARRTGKITVDGTDGPMQTYPPYLGYRASLYELVKLWNLDVVNCTEGGILTDLPRAVLKDCVKSLHYTDKAGAARLRFREATGGG